MSDTPGISDRLTRVEVLLNLSLENQQSNRERLHDVANSIQVVNGEMSEIRREVKNQNVKETVEKLDGRVDVLEKARERVLTAWVLLRWSAFITGSFFSLAVMLGDRIAKWPIWSLMK